MPSSLTISIATLSVGKQTAIRAWVLMANKQKGEHWAVVDNAASASLRIVDSDQYENRELEARTEGYGGLLTVIGVNSTVVAPHVPLLEQPLSLARLDNFYDAVNLALTRRANQSQASNPLASVRSAVLPLSPLTPAPASITVSKPVAPIPATRVVSAPPSAVRAWADSVPTAKKETGISKLFKR